jgi:hypothetical protein
MIRTWELVALVGVWTALHCEPGSAQDPPAAVLTIDTTRTPRDPRLCSNQRGRDLMSHAPKPVLKRTPPPAEARFSRS